MPVHNTDIQDCFNQVADLLEIKGANQFRVRAYRDAARTVGGLSRDAAEMVDHDEDLSQYSGIGKDLAGKIAEIAKTGKLSLLEDLKREMPGKLSALLNVSGLGAKRVAALYEELDIDSVEDLQKAAENGEIQELEGFGPKTEQNVLDELQRLGGEPVERTKIAVAEQFVLPLVEYLESGRGVKDIVVAGSYRRRCETVGDIDILATCKKGSPIMDRFVKYDDVKKVVSKGKTKSTVLLRSGLQVDLRVVAQVSYGSALLYFTGSKAHNIAVRKIAVKKKLKISEYGVFKGDDRVAGKTEEQVYKKVGLVYVEPEMREDRGELDLARKNKLPELVTLKDIRGDLHVHTRRTDGHHSIKEIVAAVRERGYDYVAITDHSKSVTVANGLKPKELEQQIDQIDKLNDSLDDVVIFKGSEVDILEDGSLDLPDSILKRLDLTVCSVHSKFKLSRKKQTRRIVKAMQNKYFAILGHATGRLIGEREPYDIDLEQIMKAAKKNNVVLELNAHPDRLDLNDAHCKMAKDMGVKVVISTDTHRIDDLEYMRFGVNQARRGWLEAGDILNTLPRTKLRKALRT